MNFCTGCKICSLTLFLSFYIFLASGIAESFPFRTLDLGEKVPDATLIGEGSESIDLRDLQGQPVVLMFWGGDLAAKKQRAIVALTELQQLTPFLAEKNIILKVVNTQGDSQAVIDEVIGASAFTGTMYHDVDHKLYGALGVFIMPSVLLLDDKGIAVAGMGFSKDMTRGLKGEIQIMLGEKTRAELEAELHPVMVERPESEKVAGRRLQMGYLLSRKGQLEEAQREFRGALAEDATMYEAYIELGCIDFQLGNIDDAEKNLDKWLDLDVESLRGEICYAQVTAAKGDVDTAIDDLKSMLFRNDRNSELHYVLGTLYDKKENHVEAAKEYSKAYELLLRKTHFAE